MNKETLKNIFKFLEKNDNTKAPFIWKLENNIPFSKEDLKVDGYLILNHTEITSLPKDLQVNGFLNLRNSSIETLPEGLKVGGYLDLRKTKITSLPEGLEVGSYLDIEDTKITLLPKGLQVGSSLYIDETPLTKYSDDELREMVKPGYIKGDIIRQWRQK